MIPLNTPAITPIAISVLITVVFIFDPQFALKAGKPDPKKRKREMIF